jgi:hypothetical protein
MSRELLKEPPVPTACKAVMFADTLPERLLHSMESALRGSGCSVVERISDIDTVVTFDCSREGCPRQVDPRLAETVLALVDQEVAGVSGFEILGVLRGLPETQNAKIVMLGPHGPHDHRSVLAAWGLNVDCYLTRNAFLDTGESESQIAKLGRMTKLLLAKSDAA